MQAFHPYPLTNCHSLDGLTDEETQVSRQSYAGLLWSKQFYHYIIQDWLKGDPEAPAPPRDRLKGRNSEAEWAQLFNRDVVSMPDKWEYPWVSRTIINVFFFQFKVALWDHDTIVGDQKITDRARLIQDRKGRDKVTLELGENRCDNFGFTVSRLNFFPTFETLLWSQEVSMNEGVLLPKIWMWLLRNRFPCFYRPLNMVLYCVRCVLIRLQDIGYGPWVSLLQWLIKKKPTSSN